VATAGLALGCLTLLVAGSPVELGIGVALTGSAIHPILVLCTLLAQSAVRQSVLTQAFVWLNSASAAGSASAAAATGWAVTTFGAHGGFAVAATATSVAAILAAAGLQSLRAPQQPKPAQPRTREPPVS
jgi:dipeptide/tripeptide permease